MAKKFISELNITNPDTGVSEDYGIIPDEEFGVFISPDETTGAPKNLKIAPSKVTYGNAHLCLEPEGDLRIKATDDIGIYSDNTDDLEEVLIKALCKSEKNAVTGVKTELGSAYPIRMKLNASELELNTKGCPSPNETVDVKFKTGNKNLGEEKYSQVKMKGRSFDIRCNDHGGIALQIAGQDKDNHENKIKFESSRTSEISDPATYTEAGGDGLEFATFNNLHTSIYTGDYRFKGDAKVYGVSRGNLVTDTVTGKTDYPTQPDDFKDIIDPEAPSATWEDIIWAGSKREEINYVLTHGTTGGSEEGEESTGGSSLTPSQATILEWAENNKNSLENLRDITVPGIKEEIGTKAWTETVEPSEEGGESGTIDHPSTGLYSLIDSDSSRIDNIEKIVAGKDSYIKISGKGNLGISNPDGHNLNLESSVDIKLEATGSVKVTGSSVDITETPSIQFATNKLSSMGEYTETEVNLKTGFLNNCSHEVWLDPVDGKFVVKFDEPLWTAANVPFVPSESINNKAKVYTDSEATILVDKGVQEYYYLKDSEGVAWVCVVNKSNAIKKFVSEKFDDNSFRVQDNPRMSNLKVVDEIPEGCQKIEDLSFTAESSIPAQKVIDLLGSVSLDSLETKPLSGVNSDDSGNITSADGYASVNDVYIAFKENEATITAALSEMTETINSLKATIAELQDQVKSLGGTIENPIE